ncbi:probable pectinesterase/pectinesterase inhibitor 33 [Gossypium arboreum]|uniref:probable pectinesterase/pectinesterase inhibitor 33 n=1 Tax=Gossypium arboreum TaxID=29729 RepID=UPI0008191BAC|nr:probable pectinesterase/pectinesterase inhibitor 33 [Gossypium arboreum]
MSIFSYLNISTTLTYVLNNQIKEKPKKNSPILAMEIKILLVFFVSLSSMFSTTLSRSTRSNITWWCNQTPHPEPCLYLMSHGSRRFAPKHMSQFRKIMVQLAFDRAVMTGKKVNEFGQSCENWKQKAAWRDCLKLFDNTILQLNTTLRGLESRRRIGCNDFDAQTWLSTALTNIQTCEAGFMDFNVSDFFTPSSSNNISQMISNSLAVNGIFLRKRNLTQVFPGWLSRHHKRLLLSSTKAHIVVAKDGSGNFRTVQAALDAAAKRKRYTRFIIHVKRGVYRENIEVSSANRNVMLVGDGMKRTIITSSRSAKTGYTTYSSATAGIDGPGFIARDITFSNTAGPTKGQAVALRSASDLSVFYRCAIVGHQDTLMVHSQRQFYRECYIYGTVDIIFGNAAVVLQSCSIFARRPLKGQANIITAQGRGDPYQTTGIAIHNSRILAANDLKPVVHAFNTYLGRPWQQYSRTVVLKTYLDSLVSPAGWSKWGNSDFALGTLYYGEYKNYGPSSSTKWRVKWPGFHVITSASMASRFTVNSLIAGGTWLPTTGVPFTAGL